MEPEINCEVFPQNAVIKLDREIAKNEISNGGVCMKAKLILKEADQRKEQIIEDRRYLHEHPGTGFEIEETLSYVEKRLESMGYEPKRCGKAGLTATIGNPEKGKTFLLRADMDALPIREESGESFASKNGCMHACGHDLHTAMLLGAAAILKEQENALKGCIKLMFQPAEEIFEGSKDMLANGLLENPKVDAALMIHVMAGMPFEPGTVVVSAPGVSAPAADYFEIKVKGKGCHGSMPNTGIDPLTAAAHILIALQELQARELAMSEQAALTIGSMNGGTAANAIPDEVIMGGSLRTFAEETREMLKSRLTEISRGIAKAFRAEATVTFGSGCPTLVNDKSLAESVAGFVKELLGEEHAFTVSQLQAMGGGSSKSAGSEDFAYISQEIPSVMIALAAGQPEKGFSYPQHHPMVKFDEAALSKGSAVYAYTAMRWLEEHN